MHPAIVGDHIRHREDPRMTLFGERVDAHAGQRAARRDQPLVHAVHPPHDAPDAVEVQHRNRGAGQDAGAGGRRDQGTHRRRAQLHVGIEIHPGEGTADRVAEPDGVRLAGHRGLDHPYAGLLGDLGGTVGARVRDHDDVELAGGRAVEKAPQAAREDGLLVVRRDHDADHRSLAHAYRPSLAARQDSRALPHTESEPAVHD
jgi:hypothetical protein